MKMLISKPNYHERLINKRHCMRKSKSFFLFLLTLVCLLMLFLASHSYAESSGEFWGLTWTLSDEGVLEITGSGDMHGFPNDAWLVHKEEITEVIISEGISSVGCSAFDGCCNMTSISIPSTATKIEGWAFKNCSSLTEINIPENVTSIDIYTFQVRAVFNKVC